MKFPILIRIFSLAVVVGAVGSARMAQQPAIMPTSNSLTVNLTMLNGAHRSFTLEGVGCSSSMCSRVFVNSRASTGSPITKIRLDGIVAIQDISQEDALFFFKDGTQRRLSVIPQNRVLYLQNATGRVEKLDLTNVRSAQF